MYVPKLSMKEKAEGNSLLNYERFVSPLIYLYFSIKDTNQLFFVFLLINQMSQNAQKRHLKISLMARPFQNMFQPSEPTFSRLYQPFSAKILLIQ
jgi:hypothetical protein